MLKNTISVTFLLILTSVLGFIAQIVFVSSFGASVEMDIYFTLLAVPTMLTGIAPMIFASVLIPSFAKLNSDQLKLNRFINSIWIFIIFLTILFAFILCIRGNGFVFIAALFFYILYFLFQR